jgi:hypothetical protein
MNVLNGADYEESPPLEVAAAGAQVPASRIFRINSFGTGTGFSRRIEQVVLMISNRSVVPRIFSAVAFSHVPSDRAEPDMGV